MRYSQFAFTLKRKRPTQWLDESDQRTYNYMHQLETQQMQLYSDIVYSGQLMASHQHKYKATKGGLRHMCDFNNLYAVMRHKRRRYQALNTAMCRFHRQGPEPKRRKLH